MARSRSQRESNLADMAGVHAKPSVFWNPKREHFVYQLSCRDCKQWHIKMETVDLALRRWVEHVVERHEDYKVFPALGLEASNPTHSCACGSHRQSHHAEHEVCCYESVIDGHGRME